MPNFGPSYDPTLFVPVTNRLSLNPIHAALGETNQTRDTRICGRLHALGGANERPNPQKPAEPQHTYQANACAFPIALPTHPTASI